MNKLFMFAISFLVSMAALPPVFDLIECADKPESTEPKDFIRQWNSHDYEQERKFNESACICGKRNVFCTFCPLKAIKEVSEQEPRRPIRSPFKKTKAQEFRIEYHV